jgi:Tfp pilus assembly protein PilO
MSTTLTDRVGPIDQGKAQRHPAKRSFAPPHAWSVRRPLLARFMARFTARFTVRFLIMGLIAVATFAIGANAWIAADLAGAQATRVLLGETQRRVDRAQRAVSELPALRASAGAAASASPTRASESGISTDDLRIVSQLAARDGITLLALEPGTVTGAGLDAMRPLRMTALASFPQWVAFVRALPSLPVLIVPGELLIKQANDASASGLLSVSATLNVFDALRPSTRLAEEARDDLTMDDEDIIFYDPFSRPLQPGTHTAESDAVGFRLVGLLYDFARGLGLVETPDGETTLEAGQHVGRESVARVDGLGITFAARDGSERRLAFEEAMQ